jgi:peptide/nickel transport system permease protein
MSRRRYLAGRLLQIVPILFGVSILVFLLVQMVPGDPARTLLGPTAPESSVEAMREELGLEEPLVEQYAGFAGGVIKGEPGNSMTYDLPLTDLVAERWAPTVWLILYSAVLVILITVPLALAAARRPGGIADQVVRALAMVSLGMPSFWLGLLLILLFATNLGWFPVSGYGEGFFGHLHSLFLPAVTIAVSMTPMTVRSLRSSLIDVLESDYLVAVRAKGLSSPRVWFAYVLRVAVLPVITVLGVNLGWLIGNTVVIEQIFVIPGLGSMMVDAIVDRDFPVVQYLALVFALMVLVVSLVSDLARSSLDPRIELS